MVSVYVGSVGKNGKDNVLEDKIKDVFMKSSDNLSWLSKGDTVLLKPALNSGDAYPATTHKLAIKVVRDLLIENGADVIVGDQSGIENVLHSSEGVVYGSSEDNFYNSGMGDKSIKFVAFENDDWDSFYYYNSSKLKAWKNGFYLTRWIKEVNHIILLPRISTHVMSGVTFGMKNLVGCLREDSRVEFHADGPFSFAINSPAKKGNLKTDYENENRFIEKIVEIALPIKNKIRCSLFVATEAQTTFGPDSKIMGMKSYISKPEEGLVFGSKNIVASDIFALAFLKHLRINETPRIFRMLDSLLLFSAKGYHDFSKPVRSNNFIRYAIKIGLGNSKVDIDWGNVSAELRSEVGRFL